MITILELDALSEDGIWSCEAFECNFFSHYLAHDYFEVLVL
jgi:hypothetical protein